MKKNLLFLIILVLINIGFSQEQVILYFPLDVEISNSIIPLFDQTDFQNTYMLIRNELINAWENTLLTYINNKGQLDPCLKEVFDKWIYSLAVGVTTFDLTEWDPVNNMQNTVSIPNYEPNKNPKIIFDYKQIYRTATPNGSLKSTNVLSFQDIECVYEGENSNQIIIRVFNGFRDYRVDLYRAEYKKDTYSCIYRKMNYIGGKTPLFEVTYPPPSDVGTNGDGSSSTWSFDSQVGPFSLSGALFHELTHGVLYHCGGDLGTRKSDEATIEDIMLKIFPAGCDPYHYEYEYELWRFRATRDDPGFPYKQDLKSRIFNPPSTLKYNNPDIVWDYIQGMYIQGKAKGNPYPVLIGFPNSETCDDAKCSKLIRYQIPYLECCR